MAPAQLEPRRILSLVGVGQSSTPILAFLENLGSGVAAYLPFDGLGREAKRSKNGNIPGGDRRQRYFDHFRAFLPPEILRGEREIVLFRRSDEGKSLEFVRNLLRVYIRANGGERNTRIRIVALSAKDQPNVDRIDVRQGSELRRIGRAKYRAVAPYRYLQAGSVGISVRPLLKRGIVPRRSSEFGRFKSALADRMGEDAELASAVQKLARAD